MFMSPNSVHVVVVPRVVSWVTDLLEEEGLYGALILHEFCPDFIPLDDDLLSLEMTSFFRCVRTVLYMGTQRMSFFLSFYSALHQFVSIVTDKNFTFVFQ